jgi:hypothetical protein
MVLKLLQTFSTIAKGKEAINLYLAKTNSLSAVKNCHPNKHYLICPEDRLCFFEASFGEI